MLYCSVSVITTYLRIRKQNMPYDFSDICDATISFPKMHIFLNSMLENQTKNVISKPCLLTTSWKSCCLRGRTLSNSKEADLSLIDKGKCNFCGDSKFFARSCSPLMKAKSDSFSAAHTAFHWPLVLTAETPHYWHYKQNPLKLSMSKVSRHELSTKEHYIPFHLTH